MSHSCLRKVASIPGLLASAADQAASAGEAMREHATRVNSNAATRATTQATTSSFTATNNHS